mgnify:CR=1 FL=1
MSQAVESLNREVKTELDEKLTSTEIPEVEFDLVEVYNHASKNKEILGMRYQRFLSKLFESIEKAIRYHIDDDITQDDIFDSLSEWIDYLIENTDSKHNRTTHLYQIQDLIESVRESTGLNDTVTIVFELNHRNARFWVHNNPIENPEIRISLDNSSTYAEKSSLQSYTGDFTNNFVDRTPYENRPRPQWKRTLTYSITNTDEETIVEADRISERLYYNRMERLFRFFGLEHPSRDEPIPTNSHNF